MDGDGDGDGAASSAGGGRGQQRSVVQPERMDFWDSFGAVEPAEGKVKQSPSSIGTVAVKKGAGDGTGAAVPLGSAALTSVAAAGMATEKKGKGRDDGWDDW